MKCQSWILPALGAQRAASISRPIIACHDAGGKLPAKHQLLLEFADGSALSATIQMWGALLCFKEALRITGSPGSGRHRYPLNSIGRFLTA